MSNAFLAFIIIGFIIFIGIIILVGYLIYRRFFAPPDIKSVDFKPGDKISFRPAFGSEVVPIGNFPVNDKLYVISGPRISSAETCPLDDVGISEPSTLPCDQSIWLYDTDKSLRPSYDTGKYIRQLSRVVFVLVLPKPVV